MTKERIEEIAKGFRRVGVTYPPSQTVTEKLIANAIFKELNSTQPAERTFTQQDLFQVYKDAFTEGGLMADACIANKSVFKDLMAGYFKDKFGIDI